MKIKICGLKQARDVEFANIVKPDYIGFVFALKKRKISFEQAASLKKLLSKDIGAVGVFIDEPAENIIKLLNDGVIDIAQLHGNETEEDIQYIKAVTGKKVIKAVRVHEKADVEAWLDSSADYLLFDSGAGSGEVFDWRLLDGIDRDFFLAGGLNADNLSEVVRHIKPYAVDLSSGVETDGVKDFERMKQVVEIVRTIYERK